MLIHKEGDRLTLNTARKNRLLDLLATWTPLDDYALPEVEDLPLQQQDAR